MGLEDVSIFCVILNLESGRLVLDLRVCESGDVFFESGFRSLLGGNMV